MGFDGGTVGVTTVVVSVLFEQDEITEAITAMTVQIFLVFIFFILFFNSRNEYQS
jgi:hypothetical protein